MATSVLSSPYLDPVHNEEPKRENRAYAASLITGLTVLAFIVHGFHPFAEDGGLYLAGVKSVLDPSLYSSSAEFVQGHLRFSLFAPSVAWLVRSSGMRLEAVLLLIHLASIWLTLAAAWMLASRCFSSVRQRTGAVSLLAVWLTLPIAGTSLMLMDPYVTARSISTPLTLLALVWTLDFLHSARWGTRWNWISLLLTVLALLVSTMAHPLMAAYGFGCVLALSATLPERPTSRAAAVFALGAAAVIVAVALQTVALPESPDYHSVAMSRYYWFLSQWHWYELVGVVAPLAILTIFSWPERSREGKARWALARMGLTAGTIALAVAAFFARVGSATHLVARLQPMRIFQQIYVVMILLLGGTLARWMGKRPLRWAGTFGLLAVVMFFAERQTFPSSEHIEMTEAGEQAANGWVQAFEWIKKNTPKNAVFALDADYITKPGEDAQSFRAIAERTALPDYSKDGGEAAITPALTEEWKAGQEAQTKLSERSDADRLAKLTPKGVEWIVLEKGATTAFVCDYANATVKVCRLPNRNSTDGVRLSLRNQPTLQPQPLQALR